MTNELIVLLDGRRAGTLTQGDGGVLALAYDDSYRGLSRVIPVSLSMPLADVTHSGRVVHAFCQGLLPDNVDVLERWARDFQVSARNPITSRHWEAFADRNALDPVGVKARIDDLARRLPDAFRQAAETEAVRELKSKLPGRLAEKIGEHAERCRLALAG